MKIFWLLSLFALAVSAFRSEEGREHGENGWYVPQEDGSFKWMDLDEWERIQEEDRHRFSLNPVKFYLYTQANPTKYQKIKTTKESIGNSNFNASNPTGFISHGWLGNLNAALSYKIHDAWLSKGDYNVIVVSWGRARATYASAVLAVPGVGKKVAAMIDFLVKNYDMSLENLNVIGHSLGAHVAGFAGKNTQSGKIHTIVGLDPALPLFRFNKPKNRLDRSDAFYVESIQTNGGKLGFLKPIGKGAFYPNGGKKQPGCGLDLSGACSHSRSTAYYAEAVQKDSFLTIKCSNYEDAVKNSCGTTYSSVRMGAVTNAYKAAGDFYVQVKNQPPYGMAA